MRPFKYFAPETLEEAVLFHNAHEGKAEYIAGGTDVIVKIKDRWLKPDYLISLKKIGSLDSFYRDGETGDLHIGSMVTHSTLENSSLIRKEYPVIYDAVSNIGSLQIRNVGTVGGNLVNAVPSADSAVPLIALDGMAFIYGPEGRRSVPVKDFFVEPYKTVLEHGEILTEIRIGPQKPRTGSSYIKFGRRAAMELPLIGVGVLLSVDDDLETCTRARICLGVAGPTPMRALEAERLLVGRRIDKSVLNEAGEIAVQESRVRDSVRGKAWHRKEMIRVQVRRMGLRCLEIIRNNDQA